MSKGEHVKMKGIGMLPLSGMYAPRNCWMRFNLPVGVFQRFETTAGMNLSLVKDGAAFFIVKLDEKEIFRSGRMSITDEALKISITLKSAKSLTLLVEDANNGKTLWNNHALW
jgi:hypothetical protein